MDYSTCLVREKIWVQSMPLGSNVQGTLPSIHSVVQLLRKIMAMSLSRKYSVWIVSLNANGREPISREWQVVWGQDLMRVGWIKGEHGISCEMIATFSVFYHTFLNVDGKCDNVGGKHCQTNYQVPVMQIFLNILGYPYYRQILDRNCYQIKGLGALSLNCLLTRHLPGK